MDQFMKVKNATFFSRVGEVTVCVLKERGQPDILVSGGTMALRSKNLEPIVLVSQEVITHNDPNAIQAVVAHEIGHLELNHECTFSWWESLKQDWAADRFSVVRFGKRATLSGIALQVGLTHTFLTTLRVSSLRLWFLKKTVLLSRWLRVGYVLLLRSMKPSIET